MKLKKAERERRMRVMAKAKVEMLLGVYQWPNGRCPIKDDGSPVVSNREILRVGDYAPTYKLPERWLFSDPYFVSQVNTEMTRREKKASALVSYDPTIVQTVRDLFWVELESRLRSDPSTFSNAQLIAGAEKFELLSRAHENRQPLPKSPDMMNQFNSFISRTVTVMNDTEKERLIETSAEAAQERVDLIKKLIDEANIVEADADDLDVTDAEIDPE